MTQDDFGPSPLEVHRVSDIRPEMNRQNEKMVFAGLIAASEWKIDPLAVRVMFVPPEAGRGIFVEYKDPIKDNYISVECRYIQDIVMLQEWRCGEFSIFLGYSELCHTLVVRCP